MLARSLLENRLAELLSQMEALGYARQEALALCGLGASKPSPERLETAVAFLERHLEFARKCLAAVQNVGRSGGGG